MKFPWQDEFEDGQVVLVVNDGVELGLEIDSSLDLSLRNCFPSKAEEEGNWELIWRKELIEVMTEAYVVLDIEGVAGIVKAVETVEAVSMWENSIYARGFTLYVKLTFYPNISFQNIINLLFIYNFFYRINPPSFSLIICPRLISGHVLSILLLSLWISFAIQLRLHPISTTSLPWSSFSFSPAFCWL